MTWTVDRLAELPRSGRALLNMYRWMQCKGITEGGPVEMLTAIASCASPAETIDDLAESQDADKADALMSLVWAAWAIDRADATAKSLGIDIEIPRDLIDRLNSLRRGSAA